MKNSQAYLINLFILGTVLLALFLSTVFHQVNMNRKYWTMVNTGCINIHALGNLERRTRQTDLAKEHITAVPRWIANINATLRLGVLAITIGLIINLVLMIGHIRTERRSEQTDIT